ncbi:peptidoglycan-binding protein [Streptomyces sp. CHD11]|uniref:peptidoglycan-binding domain-containing protein n=1 Tax=Streptomyces sp. CHD11 TaxID=2741325 RepID=UPI001BFCD37F|nr:peptidoglycan-binding domain-containing protein [Streptomyces sp. CHD11]MBT3150281.1 peptidoglycan-binding protein [Streptomyces sp. CHD11]
MTTPAGSGRQHDGPPLEPIRVLRPRRTDALAELFREFEEGEQGRYEPVPLPGPPAGAEDRTQELPPVPADRPPGTRRTVLTLAVAAAALAGFGCALLLMDRDSDDRAVPAPGPSASAPPAPPHRAEDGFLREGDAGPEVAELQERLLRVPDVYRAGSTDGRYDATLSAAVARFQLWYGIQGDETGVYGDDTRLALESRTGEAG